MKNIDAKKDEWGAVLKRLMLTLLGVIIVGLSGCERISPPLTITFRESLLDSTRVMQLTNRSGSETLVAQIEVRNDARGQRREHVLKIGPGSTEELGRLEMNWVFEPGEKFKVSCDGYFGTLSGAVP